MRGLHDLRDNYAVLLLDVDGTILQRAADTGLVDVMPSKAVCRALDDFVAAGNVILLSTGRGPSAIMAGLRTLPISGWVSMDGAYVEVGDEVVLDATVDPEACDRFLDFAEAEGLLCGCDSAVTPFQIAPEGSDWMDTDNLFHTATAVRAAIPVRSVEKINVVETTREQMERFEGLYDDFEVFYAGSRAFELIAPGVDKGVGATAALEALPGEHGVVIGIGDSENDIPVFDVCDVAVAMGNSRYSVQGAASIVVGDVNHDGVAEALRLTRHLWQ